MENKTIVWIAVVIILIGVIISLIFFNLNKGSSQITYRCEIDNTKSSTTSIGCTSNADCNIAGLTCDTLLYKCVIVPSGRVLDNNGNDITPRYSYVGATSKSECDEIGGFWKAEIK